MVLGDLLPNFLYSNGIECFLKINAEKEERQHRKIVELELKTLQLQMNPHLFLMLLILIKAMWF